MKTAPSPFHFVIAAGILTLIIGGLGCSTRTSIGEIPDAGPGDASNADGGINHGSGGVVGTAGRSGSGGTLGTAGRSGSGGMIGATGEGGATEAGGRIGAPGGSIGAGGVVGGGGQTAAGGAGGLTACASYSPPAPAGPGGISGTQCWNLTYPASGFYGDNILADGCAKFTSGVDYELAVNWIDQLPVQVKLTSLSITGNRPGVGGAAGVPVLDPGWYSGADGDWRTKDFDPNTQQQLFQSRDINDNETSIQFQGTGTARVDIYDCDPNTPSRSKIISWGP